MTPLLEYDISARRGSAMEGRAHCKQAEIVLDTTPGGRPDAFNPAELFLTSLAACILKDIERLCPILQFGFLSAEVQVHGVRQDKPPRMVRVAYEIRIDTNETDHRIDLLHENIRKFGTILNTIADACTVEGRMIRTKLP
jgi:uncharacterized OsmC-like protein